MQGEYTDLLMTGPVCWSAAYSHVLIIYPSDLKSADGKDHSGNTYGTYSALQFT